MGFGLSNNAIPFFPICHQLSPSTHSQHLKNSFYFLFPSFPGSSPSSSIGTTTHCGLWPVEQCPSIFSYLPPTLSFYSLPALEDLSFPGSSPSSSSTGTTTHCGLWPVEQCPSIFSYLPPTLSIFSLPALEDLFLLPLSILSFSRPFQFLSEDLFGHPILLHSL